MEQRFKQMESFEEEGMQLRQRVEELEARENDNKIKCEMALRDKDEIKKKLLSKDKEQLQVSQKEGDLLQKLDEMSKQIREREQMSEGKIQENFTLKQRIEVQRLEMEKLKRKHEVTQDSLTMKEYELKAVNDEFTAYKKKFKAGSAEQQQALIQVKEDLKGELNLVKSQNEQLRDKLD